MCLPKTSAKIWLVGVAPTFAECMVHLGCQFSAVSLQMPPLLLLNEQGVHEQKICLA